SSYQSLNRIRIEYGTPWYGTEIDEKNLPQELRRDEKAISFNKGCYLGQETVAKLDAFAHINKHLIAIQFDNRPDDDSDLLSDNKKIGKIRNVAYSPKTGKWLALAVAKCKQSEPGMKLTDGKKAVGTVIEVPI
ncbi:MAG: glycine cleavage T C-terminal barrel domain-containing protein, partial [Planctomycetota bacterium]